MTEDRQQLLVTLDRIRHVLAEIDRGAGFCEDRGFGWTIDNERRAGIDDVHTAFQTWPELSTLLPRLAKLTLGDQPVIGLETIPHDEVKAAIRQVKRDIRSQDPA